MDNYVGRRAKFSQSMDLPLLFGEDCKYMPVIAVFRCIPHENIDEWVMTGGKHRSDSDIAAEILLEIRGLPSPDGRQWRRNYSVAEVLAFEPAAALIVSTFLSKLPRRKDRSQLAIQSS